MKLSVVIPAYNEEHNLEATVLALSEKLRRAQIEHEILVVDDHSTDGTLLTLQRLEQTFCDLRHISNNGRRGYGNAVSAGLDSFIGEVVVICMADGSDSAEDVVVYYKTLIHEQVDCVFGSRFMKGARVVDYPLPKLVLNRLANIFIQILFGFPYNDTTNAFKMFTRKVVVGLRPFLSHHFNLTVELPLKAIIRGYSYAVVPSDWYQRKIGISKLKISEMGSRYLFIILYCFIEKWLSHGDYLKESAKNQSNRMARQSPS